MKVSQRSGLVLAALWLAAAGAASAAEPARGRLWAILIGIDDYRDAALLDLNTARQGVRSLEKALTEGPASQLYTEVKTIPMLRDGPGENYPDRRTILRKIRLIATGNPQLQVPPVAQPEDTILVYFFGHGVTRTVPGADNNAAGNLGRQTAMYLCPIDAEVSDQNTLISVDNIYEQLSGSQARLNLVVCDACRENVFAKLAPGRPEINGVPLIGLGPVRRPDKKFTAVLLSCSANETSKIDEKLASGGGVFTHYLVEALSTNRSDTDRDGAARLKEVFDYVRQRVQEHVKLQTNGADTQVPALLRFAAADLVEIDDPVLLTLPRQEWLPEGFIRATTTADQTIPWGNERYYSRIEWEVPVQSVSGGKLKLEFALVQPPGGIPFYISSSRVSNALFAEHVKQLKAKSKQLQGDSWLPDEAADQPATAMHVEDAYECARWIGGRTAHLPSGKQWDAAHDADVLEDITSGREWTRDVQKFGGTEEVPKKNPSPNDFVALRGQGVSAAIYTRPEKDIGFRMVIELPIK